MKKFLPFILLCVLSVGCKKQDSRPPAPRHVPLFSKLEKDQDDLTVTLDYRDGRYFRNGKPVALHTLLSLPNQNDLGWVVKMK